MGGDVQPLAISRLLKKYKYPPDATGTETDTYFTDVRCMMVEKCLKVKNCQNKYVKSWQPF